MFYPDLYLTVGIMGGSDGNDFISIVIVAYCALFGDIVSFLTDFPIASWLVVYDWLVLDNHWSGCSDDSVSAKERYPILAMHGVAVVWSRGVPGICGRVRRAGRSWRAIMTAIPVCGNRGGNENQNYS